MKFTDRIKLAWKGIDNDATERILFDKLKDDGYRKTFAARLKEYSDYELALSGGGYTIDPDENDYRRVTQGKRDIPPLKLERAVEISYAFYAKDPLAKRLIDIPIEAMDSAGVEFKAEDDRVKELWEEWWENPLVGFKTKFWSMFRDAHLAGEANWPFAVMPFTGRLDLAFIDVANIDRIQMAAGNAMQPDFLHLKSGLSLPESRRKMQIVRPSPDGLAFVGEVFHFPLNKPVNATRGWPTLLALVDMIDLYDQALFNDAERWAMMKNFVYDVTLIGAGEPEIRKFKEERFPMGDVPKPGTVNVHNDKEKWEAVSPDLKANDSTELSKLLRSHIGGGRGLADFMLGFSGMTNVATAREMSIPVVWMIEKEQRSAQYMVTFMFSCEIASAIKVGRQLKSGVMNESVNRDFAVKMPSVFPRDLVQLSSVFVQTVTAAASAVDNEFIDRGTAREIVLSSVNQLGIEKTLDEIEQALEKQDTEKAEYPELPKELFSGEQEDENQLDLLGQAMMPTNPQLMKMSRKRNGR